MFVQKEISILEIQSYLKEISNTIADDLRAEFTEYGLELVNFNVNEISVPENDPRIWNFVRRSPKEQKWIYSDTIISRKECSTFLTELRQTRVLRQP